MSWGTPSPAHHSPGICCPLLAQSGMAAWSAEPGLGACTGGYSAWALSLDPTPPPRLSRLPSRIQMTIVRRNSGNKAHD